MAEQIVATFDFLRRCTHYCRSTIATTVQFAVACGLHNPNDPSTSVMLPPADEIEASDRRNLWYGIAMADNGLAFSNGVPRVAPDKVT